MKNPERTGPTPTRLTGLEESGPRLLPEDHTEIPPSGLVLQTPPLLVAAPGAARLCGVSERTWRKFDRCGRVPLPLRWGKRRLWSIEELRRWTAAGCPSRERWNSTFADATERKRLPDQATGIA